MALIVGMAAGFFGGWVDAVLSRVIDILLGIPLLLAAIVLSRALHQRQPRHLAGACIVLGILGWTTAARVVRSSVITAKQQDYVAGGPDARRRQRPDHVRGTSCRTRSRR